MKELKTQIYTTKEQSKKLLALGLNKDSADMCLNLYNSVPYSFAFKDIIKFIPKWQRMTMPALPSWSLSRLISMLPEMLYEYDVELYITKFTVGYGKEGQWLKLINGDNIFDNLINLIKWLISIGQFNKKYLEEYIRPPN